jgi:YHS domain-containing protein
MRPSTLLLAAALLTSGLGYVMPASVALADGYQVNVDAQGLAIHGYDPVAYFTDGKAVAGDAALTAAHDGATYRFASAAHRDAFIADPGRYLPQYGGYCAYGTSISKKFDGDPNAWKVVDGKLYLNFNPDVQRKWLEDVPGFIAKADTAWPGIREQSPETLNAQ